eukprot:3588780-Ditylum_brightwellii.AAC.1
MSNDDHNAKTVEMTVLVEGPDGLKGQDCVRDLTLKHQFEQIVNPITYNVSKVKLQRAQQYTKWDIFKSRNQFSCRM